MTSIPAYIDRRIRRAIPHNLFIVPGSTPVVAFGNSRSARVATLGLNPSCAEFLDRDGNELKGDDRRLATHSSIGYSNLADAPDTIVAKVLEDCDSYFQRNPYRKWFDQLEPTLNACGASYYNGSACHLDLVQWATNPTWGKLESSAVRNHLLNADSTFLSEQLASENVYLVIVNGMGVVRQLKKQLNLSLNELEPIKGLSYRATRLFSGTLNGRVGILAWSTNLQSSYGVTSELRAEISRRIGEQAKRIISH